MNITANAVHPGLIMTPLMRHSLFLMSTTCRLFFFVSTKTSCRHLPTFIFLCLSSSRALAGFHLLYLEECPSGKFNIVTWRIFDK